MENRKTFIAILAALLVVGSAVAVIGASESTDAADYQEYYTYKLKFIFSGSGAEPDNVSWNFGDNSAEETGFEVTHTFASKGDYNVVVKATNEKGSSSKVFYVTIMGDPEVKFYTDGGSAVETKTVPYVNQKAQTLDQPDDPKKTGYTFLGWFVDQTCKVQWDFSENLVKTHMTLYAGWEKGLTVVELPEEDEIREIISEVKTLEYYIPTASIEDHTKNLTLSKEFMKDLKSDEKILVHFFDKDDESKKALVTWTIDGMSEFNENSMEEMQLSVIGQPKAFVEDQKKAAESIGAKEGYYLDFFASGELPYNMYVKAYVGDLYNTGDVLPLYLYSSGSMVYQNQEATVDADGYVTVSLNHCSTYAFLSFADVSAGGIDTTVIIIIAVFVVLIAAFVGYKYYRGREDN